MNPAGGSEVNPAVLVIGELNIDLVLSGLAGPPRFGGEILARDMRVVLGSASAIFASGIARLGHPVGFISKVGDDQLGNFCLQELQRNGISTDLIQTSSLPTGATVVLSTKEDRALITNLGAIADLAYADIPANAFQGYRHLHLTSYFLQSGLRPDFVKLAKDAKAAGLSVSFDPNSDPNQAWDAAIWDVISAVDILFLNEPEALALVASRTIEDAISSLSARASTLVVKLGARGAVAIRGAERVHCGAFPIKVVDTTGAGDSFAAGFVHGMLHHCDLKSCLQLANATGALSATQVGGTAGQPDQSTLDAFLEEQHLLQGTITRRSAH
jgi:sugar/nucleoside kinase (ribokinase family)